LLWPLRILGFPLQPAIDQQSPLSVGQNQISSLTSSSPTEPFLPFTHSQTPSPISSSHSSRQPTHFHFLRTRTRERESTQNQSPSWHSLLSAISSPAPEAALSVNVASDQPPPSPQQQQPFLLSRDKTDVKWDEGRAEGKKINRWKSERRTSTPSPSPLSLHSVSSFFSSSGATFFLLHRNRY
jgi:hypothetical protein